MEAEAFAHISNGFSSVYEEYERLSRENPIDISRRNIIRSHIEKRLKPNHKILELNAGSGIDALYFAKKGHDVLATDISDGSEMYINKKIRDSGLSSLRFQKHSFTNLEAIDETFDHIFSNFGGLNCTNDLETVFGGLDRLLNPNGFVYLVVMPPYYPWEMATCLKGNKNAFRRLRKDGHLAEVGNQSIQTYYHSPKKIRKAIQENFSHIQTLNIGTFYPSSHFASFQKYKRLVSALMKLDTMINGLPFMVKGIGDYYLIIFQKGNRL
jgi:ubiquinone/menaquinone biosynthesis C-methylase UbiE